MKNRSSFFIKLFIGICVFIFLFFYFFNQSKAFLLGPQIVIKSPENGETFSRAIIIINGKVTNTDVLLLNNRSIITDGFGNFEEKLILARGYNIIELIAKDKFGREKEERIEVVNK